MGVGNSTLRQLPITLTAMCRRFGKEGDRGTMNQLGIVTNCWKHELDQGAPLEQLLDQAVDYGLVAIELRQTALGTFESADSHLPDVQRLGELAREYPGCCFDYAMSLSFLSGEITEAAERVSLGREAAAAVAGSGVPHLRLVDLVSSSEQVRACESNTVRELTELTLAMDQAGGILSVENCRQPWDDLFRVVQRTWEELGSVREKLKICFDPANFRLSEEAGDSLQALAQLQLSDLSMVHLKQVKEAVVLQHLVPGEIDWAVQLDQLQKYQGPFLFEMAPGPDCWVRFEAARNFYEQHRCQA